MSAQPHRLIKLRVHAGERKEEIKMRAADCFEIWTKAPAERGMANAGALAILGKYLGVESKRFKLIKGGHSPSKIVEVL